MTRSTHLDGNALGGLLFDLFGRDMTGELGCCGDCGAINAFGAIHVYRSAPGDVMRCPACGTVLMVVTYRDSDVRVTFAALRWIEIS